MFLLFFLPLPPMERERPLKDSSQLMVYVRRETRTHTATALLPTVIVISSESTNTTQQIRSGLSHVVHPTGILSRNRGSFSLLFRIPTDSSSRGSEEDVGEL